VSDVPLILIIGPGALATIAGVLVWWIKTRR
jgi:hypothetical protein